MAKVGGFVWPPGALADDHRRRELGGALGRCIEIARHRYCEQHSGLALPQRNIPTVELRPSQPQDIALPLPEIRGEQDGETEGRAGARICCLDEGTNLIRVPDALPRNRRRGFQLPTFSLVWVGLRNLLRRKNRM